MRQETPGKPTRQQGEIDKEQAAIDGDQGVADREQARADREQEPIDAELHALGSSDAQRPSSPPNRSPPRSPGDLKMAQDRQDAHQAQLDNTQRGQDRRQDALDHQQSAISDPVSPTDTTAHAATIYKEATAELHLALRHRAEAALARAEASRERAEDALRRLGEMERRSQD